MGDYKHGPLHTPGAWGSVRVSGVPRGGLGAGPAVVIEAHGSGLYLPRAGSLRPWVLPLGEPAQRVQGGEAGGGGGALQGAVGPHQPELSQRGWK